MCRENAGGAHYPAINNARLRECKLMFPSIQKQRRIVAYLDLLQAKMGELKKLQDETEKLIEKLIPSILDKAFEGES